MTERDLVQLALEAQERAYAPYSGFFVGAALETEDGRIFTGCNVENAAYGSCLCAERGALMSAVAAGARKFTRIAIAGSGKYPCWPCGPCRQMLLEFSPHLEVLAANCRGECEASNLAVLLPRGFGPHQFET